MKEGDIMGILKIGKMNTFFVGIMMMAILLCCSSQVQAAQDQDYTYTVTDGKAEITKYTGVGGDVTIPSTLGGAPVTIIGNLAFYACYDLTTISIPQGVTSIGYSAFDGCTGLITISIPQGVTSIGDGAFNECAALTSIIIPQGVTNIGYRTFFGCTSLTSISLPQDLTSIGNEVFNSCDGLISIEIPQGVTNVGYDTFLFCTSLTSISLPQGVTSIGNGAFYCCTSLTSISLPQDLKSIGNSTFSNCTGLTSISIPQGVTNVGDGAFNKCTSLTSITLNSQTTAITDTEYTIPTTTKIIGYDPSTAKDWATRYNRTFEVIDAIPDTSGMTEMKTASPIVGPGKEWTIKLNGLVNEASIQGNIYITNSQGIKQIPTCTVTTVNGVSQINVKPANSYTPDDYILWVRGLVESGKGTKLKSQVYLKFTVQ